MKHAIVYGLVDPDSNVIRYVGQTSTGLDTRLQSHIYSKDNTCVARWVRWLRRNGKRPKIVPLATVLNNDYGRPHIDPEKELIAYWMAETSGMLVNTFDRTVESQERQKASTEAINAARYRVLEIATEAVKLCLDRGLMTVDNESDYVLSLLKLPLRENPGKVSFDRRQAESVLKTLTGGEA